MATPTRDSPVVAQVACRDERTSAEMTAASRHLAKRRLEETWNELGALDPMWAILTLPGKLGNVWDADEFFATGEAELDEVLAYVRSLGVAIEDRVALDFGCGIGRLTQALGRRFSHVDGVDIAASMIQRARALNRFPSSCAYRLNTRDDLALFEDGRFTFVYSNIVLQHMPARIAERYIGEFLRVSARDGVVVFQVPDARPYTIRRTVVELVRRALPYLPKPLIDLARKCTYRNASWAVIRRLPARFVEMRGIAPTRIHKLVAAAGGRIIAVRTTNAAGAGWKSYQYVAVPR